MSNIIQYMMFCIYSFVLLYGKKIARRYIPKTKIYRFFGNLYEYIKAYRFGRIETSTNVHLLQESLMVIACLLKKTKTNSRIFVFFLLHKISTIWHKLNK